MSNQTEEEWTNGKQYAASGIPRYERLFGKHFISTGGLETTKKVVEIMAQHGLSLNKKVLDVGSGLGGSAYYMHDQFGAHVTGVDLAPGMYRESVKHQGDRKNIKFICGYAEQQPFADNYFDFAYSRDTLLHVENKKAMMDFIFRVLKKGGVFVFTDYAWRNDEANLGKEYVEYVKDTGYHLCSMANYKAVIESAGFEVTLLDWTSEFDQTLVVEMDRITAEKESFIRDLSKSDFDYLISRWTAKRRMVANGDFKWPLFICKKPF